MSSGDYITAHDGQVSYCGDCSVLYDLGVGDGFDGDDDVYGFCGICHYTNEFIGHLPYKEVKAKVRDDE